MKTILILIFVLLTGCANNPEIVRTFDNVTRKIGGKSLDETLQRFGGKNYSIEEVEGEDDQYKITVYSSDVSKRRKKRQSAVADVCPYSKTAQVLAEKDDHKLGRTQLIVWCEAK